MTSVELWVTLLLGLRTGSFARPYITASPPLVAFVLHTTTETVTKAKRSTPVFAGWFGWGFAVDCRWARVLAELQSGWPKHADYYVLAPPLFGVLRAFLHLKRYPYSHHHVVRPCTILSPLPRSAAVFHFPAIHRGPGWLFLFSRFSRFVSRPVSATLGFASVCVVSHFLCCVLRFVFFCAFLFLSLCDSNNKDTNRSLYTSSQSHLAFHNTPCTFDFGLVRWIRR